MKKLICSALTVILLAGFYACGKPSNDNSSAAESKSTTSTTNTSSTASTSDSSSPTSKSPITISYFDKAISNYHEFSDKSGSENIVFSTNAPIKDFCFITVDWEEKDPFTRENPTLKDTLYSVEQLTSEKPLVVKNTMAREISGSDRGIMFKDQNNKIRYFYIIFSGEVGLTLVEFTNKQK